MNNKININGFAFELSRVQNTFSALVCNALKILILAGYLARRLLKTLTTYMNNFDLSEITRPRDWFCNPGSQ